MICSAGEWLHKGPENILHHFVPKSTYMVSSNSLVGNESTVQVKSKIKHIMFNHTSRIDEALKSIR